MAPSKREENKLEKSKIEIAQEERNTKMLQVRNLSDVFGFKVPNLGHGKCLILCGQKRRWGNAYKKFAVHCETDELLGNLMQILGAGGKVYEVR
ncbi:hypothetical protein pEaSNUABM55_00121 [Erwinia phage pEa_SNUABM_55]|nr:hypothetical protein pEaSNUABM55_00121 [Erwinia phage pEa_SNUABM_55]